VLRGFDNSWGYVGHGSQAVAFALIILAVAPGATSWSVDRLIRWLVDPAFRARYSTVFRALNGPPIPVWPVHLILAVVSIFYFSAGVAKIREGGSSWLSGRTLQWYLNGNGGAFQDGEYVQFFSADRKFTEGRNAAEVKFRDPWGLDDVVSLTMSSPQGRVIAQSQFVCMLLAGATVAFECGFILIFFLPWPLQYALLLCGAMFHWSIYHLMNVHFEEYMVVYLVLFNWRSLGKNLEAFRERAAQRLRGYVTAPG
jgi:hypothetical protein